MELKKWLQILTIFVCTRVSCVEGMLKRVNVILTSSMRLGTANQSLAKPFEGDKIYFEFFGGRD